MPQPNITPSETENVPENGRVAEAMAMYRGIINRERGAARVLSDFLMDQTSRKRLNVRGCTPEEVIEALSEILSKREQYQLALQFAESVLPMWEVIYAHDTTIREAIEAKKAWIREEISTRTLREIIMTASDTCAQMEGNTNTAIFTANFSKRRAENLTNRADIAFSYADNDKLEARLWEAFREAEVAELAAHDSAKSTDALAAAFEAAGRVGEAVYAATWFDSEIAILEAARIARIVMRRARVVIEFQADQDVDYQCTAEDIALSTVHTQVEEILRVILRPEIQILSPAESAAVAKAIGATQKDAKKQIEERLS